MKTGLAAIDTMLSLNRIKIPEGETVTLRVLKSRPSGNSMYYVNGLPQAVTMLSDAVVDGATWYTVAVNSSVYAWLLDTQDFSMWKDSATLRVVVHEKLYSLMMLKWM